MFRYEWNGTKFTFDTSWGPVHYLAKGQTPANVAAPMGNWVVMMTNGAAPSNASLSVVAVSQADPNKIVRINPIPLKPEQQSFIPAMLSVDLPNNRIYAWDFRPGKLAAINFSQDGKMSLAWTVDQRTTGFMTLIGPTDTRIIVGSNINPNATAEELKENTYTEQVVWRGAATGKILAKSDYFSPMTKGVAVQLGYSGVTYFLLDNGHLVAMQVTPARTSSPHTNNTTAATTTGPLREVISEVVKQKIEQMKSQHPELAQLADKMQTMNVTQISDELTSMLDLAKDVVTGLKNVAGNSTVAK